MRIESSTALAAYRPDRSGTLQPVAAAERTRDERYAPAALPTTAQRIEPGFLDAVMNVAISPRPVHQVAMLFETQRLAQTQHIPDARSSIATDAVIAYRESSDRLSGPDALSLPIAIRA